jgi:hypothetical protein
MLWVSMKSSMNKLQCNVVGLNEIIYEDLTYSELSPDSFNLFAFIMTLLKRQFP